MTTTISIPTAEYNRAKAYAKERNLSIEELFVVLLGQLTSEEDAIWDKHDTPANPYTHEELMARIDEGERQLVYYGKETTIFNGNLIISNIWL